MIMRIDNALFLSGSTRSGTSSRTGNQYVLRTVQVFDFELGQPIELMVGDDVEPEALGNSGETRVDVVVTSISARDGRVQLRGEVRPHRISK